MRKHLSILLSITLIANLFISIPVSATEIDVTNTNSSETIEAIIENTDVQMVSLDSISDINVTASINDVTIKDTSYDGRDYGLVTSVKKQRYGMCWNYSLQACAESYLIRAGLADNTIDLSEIYFLYDAYKRYNSTMTLSAYADNGSNASLYMNPVMTGTQSSIRFALESIHPTPYPISDNYTTDLNNYQYKLNRAYYTTIDSTYESKQIVKAMILNYGAATVGLYNEVTYEGKTETDFEASKTADHTYYCPEDIDVNHAVTIVGWNDTYSRYNFSYSEDGSIPSGNGAWLVKDSSGSGNSATGSGYMWVSYYDASMAGDEVYSFTVIPANQDYSYVNKDITLPIKSTVNIQNYFEDEIEYISNGYYTSYNDAYPNVAYYDGEAFEATYFGNYTRSVFDVGRNYLGNVNITVIPTDNKITMSDNVTYTYTAQELLNHTNIGTNTYKTKATVDGKTIANGFATFTSSNEDVATVNSDGTIIYKGFGTTTITASWCDDVLTGGKTLTGTHKLTINEKCGSIKCEVSELNIPEGGSYELNDLVVTTTPEGEAYTFSTNTTGVHIDSNNVLTMDEGCYVGTVTITSVTNPNVSCNITVMSVGSTPVIPAQNVYVKVGETKNLGITTEPFEDTITYTSSNPERAMVDEKGNVTGKAVGSSVINITTGTGGIGSVVVWVQEGTTNDTNNNTNVTPTPPTNNDNNNTNPSVDNNQPANQDTTEDDNDDIDYTGKIGSFNKVELYEDGTAVIADVPTNVTSVKIPTYLEYNGQQYKVIEISSKAFYNCKSLRSVSIPSSVEYIGSKAFYNCTNLTKITIPTKVTVIGSYAFQNCKKLTKITIPKNVESIGKYAFKGCNKLKTITIKSKKLDNGSKNAMKGLSKSKVTIKVPSSKKSAYKKLWKD